MFNIRVLILFFCFAILNATSGYSNDIIRCSAAEVFKRNAAENPVLLQRKQQQELAFQQWLLNKQSLKENGIQVLITIPVVIHIVYKNEMENISDQQIQTQLDILNKDFRNLNADKLPSQHPFFPLTGNAGFEFCLANLDPNGNATTGITRTNTTIDEFTDEFNELAEATKLEDQQNANMLRQMEISLEDMDGEKSIGFDDFSFDNYRQLLQNMLNQKKKEFENMPNGVFSGIKFDGNTEMQPGIIALLGYPSQKKYNPDFNYLSHELVYIDLDGNQISNNQKVILEQLNQYHTLPRFVDSKIESGNNEAIEQLSNALKIWINNQAKAEIELEDGSKKEVMSQAALDFVGKLKDNPKLSLEQLKKEGSISEKYDFNNFDLITWLIIN